ncbi:ABC transporter permease [Corynebacterium crudilactis]|uniref:Peptide ABC transporter permease n=1 Tax=Corynebacterium crudilactis TaxID=1652495 RepID=A0A172QR11_9CORY|nr:FtsX-like permease family protein [Corynebacterium crudilactis]ANE03126.1 peptide ABC transporter permease [Corynebacterium crudilactis]
MALTVLSVVLGTAFLCGSLLLTNSLERTFSSIVDAGVEGVDLGVIAQQNNPDGVPFEVIAEIQHFPEVRAVNVIGDGPGMPSGTTMTGQSALILTDSHGDPLQAGSSGTHPLAIYPQGQWVSPEPTLIDGHFPSDANEVVVNASAAKRGGLSVGDELTIITPTERVEASLSGIFESNSDVAGWVGVGFSPSRYLELFTNGSHASQITIAVHDGTDPISVRNRIGKAHRDLMPLLPEQIIEKTTGDTATQLEFMKYVLLAFAAIALIVGSFIIANTFAMIVAQRTSEFALLRSIGVSTFQIGFSVIMEAVFIGLIGGLIGIAVGFSVVNALVQVLNQLGDALSSITIIYNTGSFVIPVLFAVTATVLSAIAPAHRAGNLPPVQAFESSDARSNSLGKIRFLISAVMCTLGISLTVAGALVSGVNGDDFKTEPRLGLIGAGLLLMFFALTLSGPALIMATSRSLGVTLMAPFRTVGKLAQRNTLRNPRRSATTALAVTLSVGLVACVGVIGATTRASVFGSMESTIQSSYVLDSIGGTMTPGQPAGGSRSLSMPSTVATKVEETPGVDSVGTLMTGPIQVNGWDNESTTIFDGNLSAFLNLAVRSGEAFTGDAPGVMISTTYADQSDLDVGDTVTVNPYGSEDGIRVPITGIYAETNLVGHLMVNAAATNRVITTADAYHRSQIFVNGDGSTANDDLRDILVNAVSSFLIVQVKSKEEFHGSLGTQINQLLGIVYGLLALAVIIAVLGIVNTLFLSISERTREIGILRATGVQRGQIRAMITFESVILSIHGAILGLFLGTFVGWAIVSCLRSRGMAPVEFPWTQIGFMLLAAIIIGGIAALIPANQASRVSPLEAIS